MFTLGGQELFIIVVIALLLFGPDKIPQLARTVGRFTREFNKYKDIMESTIRMEISRAEEPVKDEITVEERIAKASAASQALIEKGKAKAAAEAAAAGLAQADEADEVQVAAVTEPEPPAPAAPSADESYEEGEE